MNTLKCYELYNIKREAINIEKKRDERLEILEQNPIADTTFFAIQLRAKFIFICCHTK